MLDEPWWLEPPKGQSNSQMVDMPNLTNAFILVKKLLISTCWAFHQGLS